MIASTTRVLSHVLIGLAGAVMLLGTLRYLQLKRSRASFPLVFILAFVSFTFLLIAFFPHLFDVFMPDTRMGRIRMTVAVMTVFIMVVTFESIRRTQLKERYALLWVIPCVLVLFLTAHPDVMDWLRASFGMEYSSTMVAVVFLSVMVSVFVLSKSISKSEKYIAKLAQHGAILEARIKALEEKMGK